MVAVDTERPVTTGPTHQLQHLPGRWIAGWEPEDQQQWQSAGRSIAQRNLTFSVLSEFLGFGVFALWGATVPYLARYGYTGNRALSDTQQFWLLSIPTLVGATLRIPYTFAVPRFGGRNWTIIATLLLLVPTVGLALAVSNHASFPVLLFMAALAGVGGGNFASSMTNISFFYRHADKGKALGLNAAGGNIGTAAVQFAVQFVVVMGAAYTATAPNVPAAGWMFVPLILIAALCAWRFMDNLTSARSDPGSYAAAVRMKHTWILSFIYFGTFGSFIGFAGAFPKILKDSFPTHGIPVGVLGAAGLSLAFMGALVGSLSRPLGGIVADRLSGWRVTVVSFVAMGCGVLGAIYALEHKSYVWFMATFLFLFIFTGVGNGSIYRMVPSVFAATATDRSAEALNRTRKIAAGAIGIVGAVGAYGGFVIPQAFSIAKAHSIDATHKTGTIVPALWIIVAAYVVMAATTWIVYGRRGTELADAQI